MRVRVPALVGGGSVVDVSARAHLRKQGMNGGARVAGRPSSWLRRVSALEQGQATVEVVALLPLVVVAALAIAALLAAGQARELAGHAATAGAMAMLQGASGRRCAGRRAGRAAHADVRARPGSHGAGALARAVRAGRAAPRGHRGRGRGAAMSVLRAVVDHFLLPAAPAAPPAAPRTEAARSPHAAGRGPLPAARCGRSRRRGRRRARARARRPRRARLLLGCAGPAPRSRCRRPVRHAVSPGRSSRVGSTPAARGRLSRRVWRRRGRRASAGGCARPHGAGGRRGARRADDAVAPRAGPRPCGGHGGGGGRRTRRGAARGGGCPHGAVCGADRDSLGGCRRSSCAGRLTSRRARAGDDPRARAPARRRHRRGDARRGCTRSRRRRRAQSCGRPRGAGRRASYARRLRRGSSSRRRSRGRANPRHLELAEYLARGRARGARDGPPQRRARRRA